MDFKVSSGFQFTPIFVTALSTGTVTNCGSLGGAPVFSTSDAYTFTFNLQLTSASKRDASAPITGTASVTVQIDGKKSVGASASSGIDVVPIALLAYGGAMLVL
ncbi:hypothetical protein HDU98_009649 [Podochytrium sp. JEL0797]|nr:hypothetical protein HDU98_009649 [Podochytrium sp. JEL0797]